MTPDTGMKSDRGLDFNKEVVAKAFAATVDEVYKRTGKKSILISHSQGGSPGWLALVYTKNIKVIVAIEPDGPAAENSIEYKELLSQKIPIAFYFSDYIENGDPKILSTPIWQERLEKCKNFVIFLSRIQLFLSRSVLLLQFFFQFPNMLPPSPNLQRYMLFV